MKGARLMMLLTTVVLSVGVRVPLAAQDAPAGSDHRPRLFMFAQGDPADSLYRLARELLNRGDYGLAASRFKEVSQKYPNSRFRADLPYYEAVARYRVGTTDELRTAARLLEPRASSILATPNSAPPGTPNRARDADLVALYFRVNLALANRGESNAAAIAARAAQGSLTCDRENTQMHAEAMNVLDQVNPEAALQLVRQVIDRKDQCSEDLRLRSVFILGRRGDAEAANLLTRAAKSDPSIAVRTEAIGWLPKLQGDAGVNALGEMLREETNEAIQRALVRTLASSDNVRARANIRLLVDRKDAPIAVRIEALNRLNYERGSADDGTRVAMKIALDASESSQLRAAASAKLLRLNITIADLATLYDVSGDLSIRQQIVGALEKRSEPEAADKLADIVRNPTAPFSIRTQALNALSRRKDPRSARLLQEIIDGKKP